MYVDPIAAPPVYTINKSGRPPAASRTGGAAAAGHHACKSLMVSLLLEGALSLGASI